MGYRSRNKRQKHRRLPKEKGKLRSVLDKQIEDFLSKPKAEIKKVRKGFSGEIKSKLDERKKRYHEYVTKDSDLWKKKKKEVFTTRGYQCQVCETTKNLQVHHNNYDTLMFENVVEDLVVLCWECHSRFHENVPAKDLKSRNQKSDCSFCSSGKKPKLRITLEHSKNLPVHMCFKCQNIFKEKIVDANIISKIEKNIQILEHQRKQKTARSQRRQKIPLVRVRKK